MIPTCARPATKVFCPGPCPCTSADGLSTRRYSAGRRNRLPSSKTTSSSFSAFFRRSSTGQRVVPPVLTRARSRRGRGLGRQLVATQPPGLVDQHDRDAVADRIGEPGLLANQLLGFAVVAQRRLAQRADQDLEQPRVYFRCPFHVVLRRSSIVWLGNRPTSMPRTRTVARVVESRHLDHRGQQPSPLVEIEGLEQRLLLARLKRADHRDRGDKALARHRGDGVPIGLDPMLLEIGPEATK